MKKILSLLMAVTMMAAVLAGCGGGDKPADTTGGKEPAQENTQAPASTGSELKFTTGGSSGTYYAFGSVLAGQISGSTGSKITAVEGKGSQGNIEMMVGVDGEGTVTGVSIVDNSETAGIGSKVMNNETLASGVGVLDQFQGKSAADGTLSVGSNVDAITGATVSTKGVTTGVNAALAVAGVMG